MLNVQRTCNLQTSAVRWLNFPGVSGTGTNFYLVPYQFYPINRRNSDRFYSKSAIKKFLYSNLIVLIKYHWWWVRRQERQNVKVTQIEDEDLSSEKWVTRVKPVTGKVISRCISSSEERSVCWQNMPLSELQCRCCDLHYQGSLPWYVVRCLQDYHALLLWEQ